MTDRLVVNRERLPNANVGDVVTVSVRALVIKIESDLIDVSGYSQTTAINTLAGEIRTELFILGLDEVDP